MSDSVIRTVRGRGAIAVALGAAALFALSAAPASGHKQGFDASLQLKVDPLTTTTTQYSGSVRSDKPACERNREITLTTGGVVIGTATSDFSGDYLVVITGTPPAKNQDVIASTPRKLLKRSKKHVHKCRPDTVTRKATGPPA
jgi:hypothetical protein